MLKLDGELRYLLAIYSEPSFHLRLTPSTATPLPLACGEDLHPSGTFLAADGGVGRSLTGRRVLLIKFPTPIPASLTASLGPLLRPFCLLG